MDVEKPESEEESADVRSCRSIEWYAEGQARIIDIDGVRVTVQFAGRKGHRAARDRVQRDGRETAR
jgi:hypothetical protein